MSGSLRPSTRATRSWRFSTSAADPRRSVACSLTRRIRRAVPAIWPGGVTRARSGPRISPDTRSSRRSRRHVRRLAHLPAGGFRCGRSGSSALVARSLWRAKNGSEPVAARTLRPHALYHSPTTRPH
jgi:hypothetical protein